MKPKGLMLRMLSVAFIHIACAQFTYPASKAVDSVDNYWNIKYPDPYRWLENLNNLDVAYWLKKQMIILIKWFSISAIKIPVRI